MDSMVESKAIVITVTVLNVVHVLLLLTFTDPSKIRLALFYKIEEAQRGKIICPSLYN